MDLFEVATQRLKTETRETLTLCPFLTRRFVLLVKVTAVCAIKSRGLCRFEVEPLRFAFNVR